MSYYETYNDVCDEMDVSHGLATIRVAADTYAALVDLSGRYESARVVLDRIDEESDDNGDPVYLIRWTEDVADEVSLALASDGVDRIPCLDERRTVARAAWETGPANTDVDWEDPTNYVVEQDDGPGVVGESYRIGNASVSVHSRAVANAIQSIGGSYIEYTGDNYWYATVTVMSADDDEAWDAACDAAFAETREELKRDGFVLTYA